MADGKIVIETLVTTDKFDKQLIDLENKIKKAEDKSKLKAGISDNAKRELEEYNQEILETEKKYEKVSRALEKLNKIKAMQSNGQKLTPEQFTQLEQYNAIAQSEQKIGAQLDKMYIKQGKLFQNVEKTSLAFQESKEQVNELNQKLNQTRTDKLRAGIDSFKNNLDNVGKTIKSQIRNLGRMALSVFGVASAIRILSSASSTIGQYDEQYAVNLEYIRYVLAMAIKPVLEYIIGLVVKLLQYINYIASAWFGITGGIFKSADAFKSAKESMGGMEKSAKEIRKQLAGFDEMNVLNDDGSVNGFGGNGNMNAMPDFDLSELQGEIPEWIKWIADNKDVVLGALAGIAAFLVGIKLAAVGILGLGIGIALVGIIGLIASIIQFINDPSWENFNKILGFLAVTIAGVGIAMLAFNATNPAGWIVLAIAAVVGLVASLSELTRELNEDKTGVEDLNTEMGKLKQTSENLTQAMDNYAEAVDGAEKAQKNLEEIERKNHMSGEELYNLVRSGELDYKNMTETQRETYKAYLKTKEAQDKLAKSSEEVKQKQNEERFQFWMTRLAMAEASGDYEKYKDEVTKAFNQNKLDAASAADALARAYAKMDESARETFVDKLPEAINDSLDVTRYMSAWDKFKMKWNNFWRGLTTNINMRFSAQGGGGGSSWAKGGIVYPKLKRFAGGGIINQPNRGVPLTGAIGGESGMEGIMPLTDSQQMEILGEAIGRYITINANIVNTMNGRVISRELKQIKNQQAFASNS